MTRSFISTHQQGRLCLIENLLPSGPNDQRFGPRFFPTNDLYNKKFRDIGKQVARSLNLDGIVREGVYTMVGGPNYETVAELKMLRELGNTVATAITGSLYLIVIQVLTL